MTEVKMHFQLFNEFLYLDETSPSYLRWKVHLNSRAKKDSVAGCLSGHGYWRVTCKGKYYPGHLIVMVLSCGEYRPNLTVDHINNCPSDNRPENLRWATRSDQNKNRRRFGSKTIDNTLNDFEKAKASGLKFNQQ